MEVRAQIPQLHQATHEELDDSVVVVERMEDSDERIVILRVIGNKDGHPVAYVRVMDLIGACCACWPVTENAR